LGLLDCADELCDGEPRALVLLYTNATLGTISLNTKTPCRTRYFRNLGADSTLRVDDSARYWKDVRVAVEEALQPICDVGKPKTRHVEQIIVVGERGTDQDFLRMLQDVHGGMPRIRSLDQEGHVFAAARGAAEQARRGMIDAFDNCLKNDWCPQPPEEKGAGLDVSPKGEL
jgi:hypothetical protein